MEKEEAIKQVINYFASEENSDKKLFNEDETKWWLNQYLCLKDDQEESIFQGKFFLGINVKTDSTQDLRPISIWENKEQERKEKPDPEIIADGGKITDINNPPEDVFFIWNPDDKGSCSVKIEKENGVFESGQNEVIEDFFRHPWIKSKEGVFGPEHKKEIEDFFRLPIEDQNKSENKIKYPPVNILGDIYFRILNLKEPCYVWLFHVDRELSDEGISNSQQKYLSFILVVCEKIEDIKIIKDSRRIDLLNLIMLIKSRYVRSLNNKIKVDAKKIKVGAIKSAKAAIMSRNLSHNLGSHVMSYMKQSLTSVQEMVKSGALECAHKKGSYLDAEMPFLVGMGKFISYLQERQDYIATVSTNYIPYPSIVNFKDAIYDELNSDYRFYRHKDHRQGFKPANLLLENIAKSEGLSRKTMNYEEPIQNENNIFLNFRSFNGVNQSTNDHEAPEEIDKAYEDLRRWNFSLPGGTMGRQAVFSIVENVIRNAAKHGRRKKGDSLTVTFDIFDPTDEKDRIRCENDTFLKNNYFDKNSCEYGDLYVVTLTADTDASEETILKINETITNSLNDFSTNLQQSNKGIKEMLISAAWLRSIRIEELEEQELKNIIPILKAREVDKKLQYVFCLPKVKEVALVSDNLTVDEDTNELMNKAGWRIFKYVDYYNLLTSKNFNFVVIDNNENFENVRKCSHNNFFLASKETSIKDHKLKTDIFSIVGSFNKIEATERKKEELSIRQKVLEDLEKALYKELAGEDNFTIAIEENNNDDNDNKDYIKHYNERIQGDKVKVLDKNDKFCNFSFFYRKHNDSEDEFEQFITKYGLDDFKTKLAFVEGISGGNSTDRLVRHGELDDLWAYKQIHAMRTKVAIFDERLFSKFAGYDPSMADTLSDSWSEKLKGLEVADAKKKIREYDTDRKIVNTIDDELYDCKTVEDVVSFGNKYFPLSKGEQTSYLPLVMHKKGIGIFTLIPEGDNIAIWGYDMADSSTDGKTINYGKVKKIGVLNLLEGNKWCPEIHFISGYSLNSYHYLTIHQGLLDKVYENDETVVTSENKLAVTKALYNKFIDNSNEDNDWLQGLTIHSGRSKPNTKDMPQHQPFIQYSALENAVYDCKYTLVELLDYACFETNE